MNKGTWVTTGYTPGDLLIMDFDGKGIDHIGILEQVNPDGSLVTIEGNTGTQSDANGGSVMRRTRYLKQVIGACRPAYTATMIAEKVLKIARGQIGTAEDPPSSNKVKYNEAYYGRSVSGPSYPWCVTFVWWCFAQAGMAPLFYGGGKTAGCTTLATYYGYRQAEKGPQGKQVTVQAVLPMLGYGAAGRHVKKLQSLLNVAIPGGKLDVDGDFGLKTQTAVRVFQAAAGLVSDGVAGQNTWTRLLT